MSDAIWVQIIGTLGTVLTALIAYFQARGAERGGGGRNDKRPDAVTRTVAWAALGLAVTSSVTVFIYIRTRVPSRVLELQPHDETVPAGGVKSIYAGCKDGYVLVSGGYHVRGNDQNKNVYIRVSEPTKQRGTWEWHVVAESASPQNVTVTSFALCGTFELATAP
jgi:hypothetical protein